MSKWTETRDAVGDGAKKAWEAASPEARAFSSGLFTGIVLSVVAALVTALILWSR